ncbi:hypothetical protein LAZ67_21000652 [Cordylochernes scorpioides]|uniref:alkaline phosphatase n=1 Tax=Cordylochernes scorpioides TaxID=51811 RepID=A0ABY6LPG8_9ARAC|nr:hypothetical protein LAZ67_21000652 [Cordylochernes scorpioides]
MDCESSFPQSGQVDVMAGVTQLKTKMVLVDGSLRYTYTQKFWNENSNQELTSRLQQLHNTNKAQNVIFFLGDGMGITTEVAARILKGQLQGRSGEEGQLVWEKFAYNSMSKTYSLDKQVGDSAATASAYLSGVKGNQGTIGVNGKVKLGDCQAQSNPDNHLVSIFTKAQNMGMSTGVVTTTRVTHASPAGAYAHVAHRGWEGESPSATICPDIASQLIHSSPGNKINVVLGGGLGSFLPKDSPGSLRIDNKDLIQEYRDLKRNTKHAVVRTKDHLQAVATEGNFQYVLGLFSNSHMDYILDKKSDSPQPTLAEMTSAAVKLLENNPKGFLLFVEGGRIDHAHHNGEAKKALYETLELDKAVETALNLTSTSDTLILVTADHSHTMTISGYPTRGNDILGFAGVSTEDKPYTSLTYANGPGHEANNDVTLTLKKTKVAIEKYVLTVENNYIQTAAVPLVEETHGGEDVAVHATGPWAHLFSGVHEQTLIPAVISHALFNRPWWSTLFSYVQSFLTLLNPVVMKSNREFENRAAIIVALRAGRSPKEIVDFLKLPKTTIYRVKKQFDEADSNKEGIATRKKHSRRSDRVRGEEFVKNVKEKIDGNPGKSMRAIAKEMDVGSMTIVRTIHEDLGLKSYALRKGQLLTENMKNNRKGKAAALLNNLKHDSFGMLRFFSDEKNFDVDQKVNPRNDRWICKDPSEIPVVMHTKFPASVMVLGVISSEGDVMPPHFFEKGLRMNADTYINVLETVVKPWMDMVAAGRKYVFQQDSAPAHKAKKTQSWLTLNVPSHWGPDIWPPNSPDCNPLDYYVWGVVERDVNKAPHTTIQSVKKAVHTVMTQMDKVIVAKACASFRTRLETVVAKNGNYIE